MTAFAIGTLGGSLAVARWQPPLTAQRLATLALFGTGLALATAALVRSTPFGAALFAVAGLCEGPLLTATLRIRADHAPPRARPQVFTLGAGLKISAAACGAALVGAASALPPPLLLLGIAALQLAAGLLHLLTRTRRDQAPHSPQAADAAQETHDPARGPATPCPQRDPGQLDQRQPALSRRVLRRRDVTVPTSHPPQTGPEKPSFRCRTRQRSPAMTTPCGRAHPNSHHIDSIRPNPSHRSNSHQPVSKNRHAKAGTGSPPAPA
ncbi:MFS transporter [Streptomyces halobius]|nr:MFS transporter [Streptomyces halobius]